MVKQEERETTGWSDRRKDRPSFIWLFWPYPGVQQKKLQKEVSNQTLFNNFKHCKSYLLEIGMIQGGQDVAYVRSL